MYTNGNEIYMYIYANSVTIKQILHFEQFQIFKCYKPYKVEFFFYKQTLCYSLKVNKVRQQTEETEETWV